MNLAISKAYAQFCNGRFDLPTEHSVSSLEKRLAISLPSLYREYILDFNGGEFDDPVIPESSEHERPSDSLSEMYGVNTGTTYAELGSANQIGLWDDNSPRIVMLPIGYTVTGYFILMSLEDDIVSGSIWLRTFSESLWIAANIEEFFTLLMPSGDA